MRPLFFLTLALLLGACSTDAPAPDSGDPDAPAVATAQGVDAPAAPSDSTRQMFEELIAYAEAENLRERPVGEIVQMLGVRLMGLPYVEGALDEPEVESLVVDLTGFDCVTYVENVLALAQAVKAGTPTYDAYTANLEDLRYRGGTLDGYCSRLHYFSDWMRDNDRRGNVRLLSQELGVPFEKTINFMSGHRDAYPKFATDDEVLACIEEVEAGLAEHELHYVPQDRIRSVYDQLEAGDIIATATDIDGLDVTHTGFVYKHADGRTGFLHASLTGEVKINDDLADYIRGNDVQTGILVARPLADSTQG